MVLPLEPIPLPPEGSTFSAQLQHDCSWHTTSQSHPHWLPLILRVESLNVRFLLTFRSQSFNSISCEEKEFFWSTIDGEVMAKQWTSSWMRWGGKNSWEFRDNSTTPSHPRVALGLCLSFFADLQLDIKPSSSWMTCFWILTDLVPHQWQSNLALNLLVELDHNACNDFAYWHNHLDRQLFYLCTFGILLGLPLTKPP